MYEEVLKAPREKQPAIVYKRILHYYSWYKEEDKMDPDYMRIIIQLLEHCCGVLKTDILPSSCMECSMPLEKDESVCPECGEVFDDVLRFEVGWEVDAYIGIRGGVGEIGIWFLFEAESLLGGEEES